MKMGWAPVTLSGTSPGTEADLSLVRRARKRTWSGPDPTDVGPHPVAPGIAGEHAEQTAPGLGAVHRARSPRPPEVDPWTSCMTAAPALMCTRRPSSPA